MADLDSILSGAGAAAPVTPETVTEETPAVVEQETAQAAEPEAEGQEQQGQKMVPHEALHAEKQKVKRYTEQVAAFDTRLSEQNTAWERRFEQLIQTLQPKPKEEEAKPLEPWDEGYTDFIRQPIEQRIAQQKEEVSQLLAVEKHGQEAVGAAYEALKSHPEGRAIAASLMKSVHPWGSIVEWHKREQERAEMADPVAYREKLKAELLAELQGGNQQSAEAQPAPVMPSNLAGARNVGTRSGPAWSGPQSLNDIFKR